MMRLPLTALSVLLLAGNVSAQESYSAKSLFFGEDDSVIAVPTAQKDKAQTVPTGNQDLAKKTQVAKKKSKSPQDIGVSYFIRLKNPDGSTRDVLASRKFKSGERFQLGLKVNRPSYVYVINEETNGKVTPLYPQPGIDNFINAMGTVFLPSRGAFEFDYEPGVEQLLVYVSQTPMPQLTDHIKQMRPDVITSSAPPLVAAANCTTPTAAPRPHDGMQLASAETYASKGLGFTDDMPCAQEGPKTESYASKGLSLSDDLDAGGMQPASYVVKNVTPSDAKLLLKIKLHHE